MPRWETALDALVDLWKYSTTDHGVAYYRSFGDSVLNQTEQKVTAAEVFKQLPYLVGKALFRAEPIYVDNDMMTVAEAGFKTLQPEPLEETDLLIPSGFMLLPRAFKLPDIRNKEVSNRALLWTPTTFRTELKNEVKDLEGILLFFFSHIDDDDDYWHNMGFANKEIDMDESRELHGIYTKEMRRRFMGPNNLLLNHVEPWPFGIRHYTKDARAIDPYVQTLWKLLLQTITVKEKLHPSKPFRKRAKKNEHPDKKIIVVTLRRPRHDTKDDHNPRHIDWDHRWLVSGHWRNQWFPSMSMHRQIWINPYIKGPEDKPLEVETPRVFELVR